MGKGLHIAGKLVVLVLAALWLHAVAHVAVCHSENALCGHDGCTESTLHTCACHVAYEPFSAPPLVLEHVTTVLIPAADETIRALLLPADIFRPPLANA